jgi:hypothetical protein
MRLSRGTADAGRTGGRRMPCSPGFESVNVAMALFPHALAFC